MGRLKEFEQQAAFQKALELFWEKGYANTSLQELLAAMQIQNGSFYNTFGGKKTLFIRALESYEQDFRGKREALFSSSMDFKKKIRLLYRHVLDRQETTCPRGCFLFNSVTAGTLEDKELRRQVQTGVEAFEFFLAGQLQIAVDAGELPSNLKAAITASLLITHMQGLMNRCMLMEDVAPLKRETEHFLKALGI